MYRFCTKKKLAYAFMIEINSTKIVVTAFTFTINGKNVAVRIENDTQMATK